MPMQNSFSAIKKDIHQPLANQSVAPSVKHIIWLQAMCKKKKKLHLNLTWYIYIQNKISRSSSSICCHPPGRHWDSWTELLCSLSKQRASAYSKYPSLAFPIFPLTRASVALMACVCDLGSQVQVVLSLLRRSIISSDADHAPREAGQVAHLVVQDPSPPLGHVGETTRWLLHQVSFNCLQQHTHGQECLNQHFLKVTILFVGFILLWTE